MLKIDYKMSPFCQFIAEILNLFTIFVANYNPIFIFFRYEKSS